VKLSLCAVKELSALSRKPLWSYTYMELMDMEAPTIIKWDATVNEDEWELVDNPPDVDVSGFTWVGLADAKTGLASPGQPSRMVVPVSVAALHAEVAKGFVNTKPSDQLKVDLPRQNVTIDGNTVTQLSEVTAKGQWPWNKRILEMFLTQAAFALPFWMLKEAVSPKHVSQAPGKYAASVQGSSLVASKDFKSFCIDPVSGDPHGFQQLRVTLTVSDLYDPNSLASIEVETIPEM